MDDVDGAPKGDAFLVASETCAPKAGAPPKPDISCPQKLWPLLSQSPGNILSYVSRGDVESLVAGCRRGVMIW